MTNLIKFPSPQGPSSQARRATILAEVVRQTVSQPWPMLMGTVFKDVLSALGLAEEDAGPDVWDALFLTIRLGLLECSDHDVHTDAITIGKDTELYTSTRTTAFVFGGPDDAA